jgi:hypothetical protein
MRTPARPPLAALVPLAAASLAAGQCSPGWTALPGGGPQGEVNALRWFDDGAGPALYAAGDFASPINSPNITRWRAGVWEPVATGRPGEVLDLVTFNNGAGTRLYTAGFSGVFPGENMSRWDNGSWSWFHTPGSWIGSAVSFDAGSGPRLIVSGAIFIQPGMGYIAQWDGSAWSAVGGGVDTIVWDYVEHDDGRGRALFMIGDMRTVGGTVANGVARWDGQAWGTLGSGFTVGLSGAGLGRCGAVFDDGSGPALFVGGRFTSPGGVQCRNIAKWTGTSWQPLGSGVDGGNPNAASVRALAPFDDGHGVGLVAAGTFTTAGGLPAAHIAMWRHGQWTTLAGGIDGPVSALAVVDIDGPGPEAPTLFAGGLFAAAGGLPAANIAAFRSCACSGNCDGSTAPPVLNVLDFNCFLNRFAAGCP